MTCDDCERTRAGLWCGYSASCLDCAARAIARSLPAFNALHNRGTGDRHDLREAILRAMPNTEYTAARRMVWAWWQHDHPAPEAPAPWPSSTATPAPSAAATWAASPTP